MINNMASFNTFVLALGIKYYVITLCCGMPTFDFDCRRQGVNCDQGKCNINTGQCDCSGVQGTDLNYKCQEKTNSPCGPNKYGPKCDLDRVEVICMPDKMFVTINPDGNFNGIISVYGKEDEPACVFKLVDPKPDYVKNRDRLEGQSLEIPDVSVACDNAEEIFLNGTSTIDFTSRDFFIQYNPNIKSDLDQVVKVKCSDNTDLTLTAGEVLDVTQGISKYKDVSVDSGMDVVTFKITIKGDPEQVTLGDEVRLVFSLTTEADFVDFSIKSCTATNGLSLNTTGYKSVPLLENNCPTSDAQALFEDGVAKDFDQTSGRSTTLTVIVSAFRFSGNSSKVGFQCDIQVCREENRADCEMTACDGITSDSERKTAESKNAVIKNNATTTTTTTTTTTNTNTTETTQNNNNSTTEINNEESNASNNSTIVDESVENGSMNETENNENSDNDNNDNNDDNNNDNNNSTDVNETENKGEVVNPESGNNVTAVSNGPTEEQSGNNSAVAGDGAGGDDSGSGSASGSDNGSGAGSDGGSDNVSDLRRRKRAAQEGNSPTRHVYSEMTVNDPTTRQEDLLTEIEEQDCMQDSQVIRLLIVLSTLAAIFFLSTIVTIFILVTKGSFKKVDDGDVGASDVYPVTGFNIPRLAMSGQQYNGQQRSTTSQLANA